MTASLQRMVLALLATSALTACATQNEPLRPNFPVAPPAAPVSPPVVAAPPTVADEAPISQAAPPPVESQPLAPLAPAARPIPAPPPEPAFRTVTTRSVTGRVVDADGRASTYEVKSGDNLIAIARKLDTTVEQLRADNGIEGSNIRPGQTLKGPATATKAYVVGSGDTLFSIARRFSVTAASLAEENDLGRNATIRSGQRLRLPEGFRDRGPTVTTTRVPTGGAASASSMPSTPEPERAAPPSESVAEPASRTVTTRRVTGRVIDVAGPAETYEVKNGDNLISIARKLDTTVDQLREDNKISGSAIRPGQKLKGPSSDAKAYVAGSGDTLDLIAQRFSLTAARLRSENGLNRNATVRSGQRIRLPDGYRDRGAIVSRRQEPVRQEPAPPAMDRPRPAASTPPLTPRPAPPTLAPPPAPTTPAARLEPPAPALPSRPQPYTPGPSSRPATRPSTVTPPAAPVGAAPLSDAQVSQLGRGLFIWPLRGDVVSGFGPKAGNQRNDGVNIRAGAGDSVRAAASGEVVYAGDQVPGFGNLVLVKHDGGWVTAYGHLSRVDVKITQRITQGQQIGQAGASGGVPEPQLHFEVRHAPSPLDRARPVDPQLVLPQ